MRDGTNFDPIGSKHGMAKITEADATAVWIDLSLTAGKDKDIAARTGLPLTTVKNITACTAWRHLTLALEERGYKRPDRTANAHDEKGEAKPNAVLTNGMVREIRRYRSMGCGTNEISERMCLAKMHVSNVARGQWSHVPVEPFEYRPNYLPRKPGRTNVEVAMRVREQLRKGAAIEDIMQMWRLLKKTVEDIRDGKTFTKQKGTQ
ncbi:MAG: hypothetical protein ACRYGG_20795 [Janthinobacterium lividum]